MGAQHIASEVANLAHQEREELMAMMDKAKGSLFKLCIEFALFGNSVEKSFRCNLGGKQGSKPVKMWSRLRIAVQATAARSMKPFVGRNHPGAVPTQNLASMMASLDDTDDNAVVARLVDASVSTGLHDFLKLNKLTMPVRMHPAYNNRCCSLVSEIEELNDVSTTLLCS